MKKYDNRQWFRIYHYHQDCDDNHLGYLEMKGEESYSQFVDVIEIGDYQFGTFQLLPKKKTNFIDELRIGQHWCMCDINDVDMVARDFLSTCGRCGGMDAYGTCPDRPSQYKKNTVKKGEEMNE